MSEFLEKKIPKIQIVFYILWFMKSCNYYEKLRLLWKVVTFMEGDDLSKKLWLFQKFVTFLVRHNNNLLALPFVSIYWEIFSHFNNRFAVLLILLQKLVFKVYITTVERLTDTRILVINRVVIEIILSWEDIF